MSKCFILPGSFCLGLTLLLSGCDNSDTPPTQEERQTIYVSPEGRGTGAPSSPTSFTTALALATPGDTIYLVAGEYRPQELPLRIRTDNLTITGAGAEQSTLLLEQANACQLIDIQAQGIQLQHFSIDGSQLDLAPENCAHPALLAVQGDQPQISHLNLRGSNPLPQRDRLALPNERAYSLISLQGSQNTLSVSQLRLDNAAQHSLMLQDALGQIEIHDLHIHHSGYRGLYLYRVDGQIEITDNRVHGAVNEGIYLRDVTGEVSVSHNHIENLLYQPTLLGGSGIEGGLVHTNTQGEVFTYIRSNQINIDPQGINRYLSGYPLLDIDGIEVNMLGTARGFAWVEDNTVQNTDDDGIDSDTVDQGELDIVIRNNRLMNIQDRSISFVTSGQGVVRGSI
uniref:right-handed parallel beta-helix repeat-containing protein n=1 Tax=Marinospirillum sp. TaxID=2183934 RepID=UPI003A85EAC2